MNMNIIATANSNNSRREDPLGPSRIVDIGTALVRTYSSSSRRLMISRLEDKALIAKIEKAQIPYILI